MFIQKKDVAKIQKTFEYSKHFNIKVPYFNTQASSKGSSCSLLNNFWFTQHFSDSTIYHVL